jgi:hypothetical protein
MADVETVADQGGFIPLIDYEMFAELGATLFQGKAVGTVHPESARAQIKGMVMFLAQAGMAQRVHARTGNLPQAFGVLADLGDEIPQLLAARAINESQAHALEHLVEQIRVVQARGYVFPSKQETENDPFEFLWSQTFESDADWNELRLRARACFTELRRPDDPIVG